MIKRTVLLSFVLALSLIAVPASSQKSLVERQKETNKQSVDAVKNRIDNIRKELVAKNKKFRVEVLEITRYKISEITGLKAPVSIESEASVQKQMSAKSYRAFLKRLKELGLLDEYYKSLEMDDEETADASPEPSPEPSLRPSPKPSKFAAASPSPSIKPSPERKIVNRPSPDLPAFNWVDAGKVSPVKHQGTCGSCWTFASAAVLESAIKIVYDNNTDVSEQSILDCSKNRSGQKAGSCENGGWYGYVFDFYQTNGIVMEEKSPYKGKNSVCSKAVPSPYKVAAWSYVRPDAGIPTVAEIKKAICEHGAIAACVKVTEAFQAYAGGIFDEYAAVSGPRDVNHAITIVGWDDSKKAWLMKNSWGTQWGEKGYMWIEYNCNNIGYGSTWAAVVQK